jgi:hypothetical protein
MRVRLQVFAYHGSTSVEFHTHRLDVPNKSPHFYEGTEVLEFNPGFALDSHLWFPIAHDALKERLTVEFFFSITDPIGREHPHAPISFIWLEPGMPYYVHPAATLTEQRKVDERLWPPWWRLESPRERFDGAKPT